MRVPFLQIEPTTRCNYICGFCAGRSMPQEDLDFDLFVGLIDSLEGLRHVELQGEGEPLLHPRFFDMVSYLNQRQPQARVSFITNGSLFTEANLKELRTCRIHKVYVSMESAEPEEFRRIRGGKLQKVEQGLKRLIELRKSMSDGGPKVGLAVTILKSTVEQIIGIGAFYQRLGLDGGLMLQPLQGMNGYAQYYDQYMRSEIPGPEERKRTASLITSDQSLLRMVTAKSYRGYYRELMDSVPADGRTCAWLENGLYLARDGTVCSCCFIKDARQHGLGRLEDGVITAAVAGKRSALLASLKTGLVPAACQGCAIAQSTASLNSRLN